MARSPKQIALIEEDFDRLGLWKIDEAIRKEAASAIAAEVDLNRIKSDQKDGVVRDLVSLYRETKLYDLLQDGYSSLPAKERLGLLKRIVGKSEFGSSPLDLRLLMNGSAGLVGIALLKACQDPDNNVSDYARRTLEKVLLDEKNPLITPANVSQLIDELYRAYQLPQPYLVTEEKLKGTETTLTCFYFNLGGNVYVLSYKKNGGTAHTVIDTGDKRNKPYILKLFKSRNIEPANIERILLTHHHHDHSGLVDVFCMLSGAKILVHPEFKGESIELDTSRFGKYMEWLPAASEKRTRRIGDVSFFLLGEPVEIGEVAKLEILGLPGDDEITHTVDQLLFLYTPKNSPEAMKRIGKGFRPTDEILFSGDLWLMHPPGFLEEHIGGMKINEIMRQRRRTYDFRPQNRKEKDALKTGFDLITVKPGHGSEFLGSKIVGTLLSQRDILVKLGFNENDDKKALADPKVKERIEPLKARSYRSFVDELRVWLNPLDKGGFGYDVEAVSRFVLRIYKEQSGGGDWAGQDRKERRVDLKDKLSALKTDKGQTEELRQVAEKALAMIEKIR